MAIMNTMADVANGMACIAGTSGIGANVGGVGRTARVGFERSTYLVCHGHIPCLVLNIHSEGKHAWVHLKISENLKAQRIGKLCEIGENTLGNLTGEHVKSVRRASLWPSGHRSARHSPRTHRTADPFCTPVSCSRPDVFPCSYLLQTIQTPQ